MSFTYRDLCSLSSTIIVMSTCFIMGVFYSNLSYDSRILFNSGVPTDQDFDLVLSHYQTLHATPKYLLFGLAFVASLGILGHIVRTFKPNPDLQYFEYGSLILYVLGICLFLTNIKTGIECSITHQWGEVDEHQGLAVLGSSNVILLCIFLGVVFIQGGLWWSTLDYEKRMAEFLQREREEHLRKILSKDTKKKQSKKD